MNSIKRLRFLLETPEARAIGLVFTFDSLIFSSWLTKIPYIQKKLDLSEGDLGLALFAMPLGLIIGNSICGYLLERWGAARSTVIALVLFCVANIFPIYAYSWWWMVATLFVVGFMNSLLNIAMNTAVTFVEDRHKVQIMSVCHGMWSVGGLAGSLIASLVIKLGGSPTIHMLAVAIFCMLMGVLVLRPAILKIQPGHGSISPDTKDDSASNINPKPDQPEPKHNSFRMEAYSPPLDQKTETKQFKRFTWPTPNLWKYIVLGIVVSMAEGVAFDWSAVYMTSVFKATGSVAALAFSAFALMMTVGRFFGDGLIDAFGAKRVITVCYLVAAGGLMLAIFTANLNLGYWPGLLGFLLLGAGCSLGAPILYSASLRTPGMAPGVGLVVFASFSFVGFLAGPPLIGFIAEAFNLPLAFGFVLSLCLGCIVLARFTRF